MPTLTFIEHDGTVRKIEAREGQSVMEAATAEMLPGIIAECGGCCACATCHVYVEQDWYDRLPPPDEMELDLLDGAIEPAPNSRLSCQIKVSAELDGMVLRTPVEQQ